MHAEDKILKNESRSKILNLIVDRPGSTFSELMRALEMKESTLRYHLRYLQRREMLRLEKRKGKKRYFSSSMQSLKEVDRIELPSPQKRILERIEDEPGIDQKTIVKSLRTNRFTLHYHLKRLKEMGMIRSEKDGRYVRYFRITLEELKKKMLKELIDDLLTGDIPEEKYLEIKKKIDRLK